MKWKKEKKRKFTRKIKEWRRNEEGNYFVLCEKLTKHFIIFFLSFQVSVIDLMWQLMSKRIYVKVIFYIGKKALCTGCCLKWKKGSQSQDLKLQYSEKKTIWKWI